MHIDIDVLVLSDVEEFWQIFEKFNEEQIVGLTAEDESMQDAWYPHHATHPFYGQFGVNAGIMMMNLTRMREMNYFEKMLYHKFKDELKWGDQDLLNMFLHQYSSKQYLEFS